MDRFSKAGLVGIILLLVVVALHPLVSPPAAKAAERYKYLVVHTDPIQSSMQKELDKQVEEGWELATPVVSEQMSGVTFIFRKEAH